jgi:hypothetical protein
MIRGAIYVFWFLIQKIGNLYAKGYKTNTIINIGKWLISYQKKR